eukprot:scaffold300407_cov18-Tisochrysis_lutea.AAC.1
MAEHERERKRKLKPPAGVRGRQAGPRTTKESKVTLAQRIREFPEQSLRESGGLLFCLLCSMQEDLAQHQELDPCTRDVRLSHHSRRCPT